MLKKIKVVTLALLALGILLPVSPAQDWASEWKEKLGTLWKDAKVKFEETKGKLPILKNTVEIGIAYGTEKKEWLEWAVREFNQTEAGKKVKIQLIPMGSVEGAEVLLKQTEAAKKIQVWSPASSVIKDLLVSPWKKEHNDQDPILSGAPLALTPMVIVMWEDRYEAFLKKYNEVNFKTLGEALNEPTGWKAIAEKPKWGFVTFGHTLPTKSNSGLLTLLLMAYDYHATRSITSEQVMDSGFLSWLKTVQKYMTVQEESTGKLMDSMLREGPSKYNAVMVYENLALSKLDTAKGKWGVGLKVVYPTRSIWNDNPYYILDVPWSKEEQKTAAKLFQQFLLSEAAQKEARDKYLLRPASLNLPILDATSAFGKLKEVMQVDVTAVESPSAEILQQLIKSWERK